MMLIKKKRIKPGDLLVEDFAQRFRVMEAKQMGQDRPTIETLVAYFLKGLR